MGGPPTKTKAKKKKKLDQMCGCFTLRCFLLGVEHQHAHQLKRHAHSSSTSSVRLTAAVPSHEIFDMIDTGIYGGTAVVLAFLAAFVGGELTPLNHISLK